MSDTLLPAVPRPCAYGALLALVMWSLSAGPAPAQDAWALLRQPGHIALLRHANAPGLTEEPAGIDLKNCALQRNLDDAGRAQARRIGDEFRRRGVSRVRLVSSQFCRALETATLMKLGPVEAQPLLNYLTIDDEGRVSAYLARLRAYLKTLPTRQPPVLISHITNIQMLSGTRPGSGEMVIVRFDPAGRLVVDGTIPAP